MKRLNKKGFTMAELLIVVAIIAVLVAIAIPVFTTQLNKAKAATDLANIRSGYAAATTTMLSEGSAVAGKVYTLEADGTVKETPTNAYKCKGKSADADSTATIGAQKVGGEGGITWSAGQKITYTVDANAEKVTIGSEN